jgi:hypothetical protein
VGHSTDDCEETNKIFKKSLFKKHRFKKGIHFEDIELIPKLVLDSKIIAKINQPFYKYFERQDSITKTHTKKGLDMFLAIKEVTNYFLQSNYAENIMTENVPILEFTVVNDFGEVVYKKDNSFSLVDINSKPFIDSSIAFIKENKKIILRPENSKYKDIEILDADDFKIWGVVSFVIHNPNL